MAEERFMTNYSALGAITANLISRLQTAEKAIINEKVHKDLERAKKYLQETQVDDDKLFYPRQVWAYARARETLLSMNLIENNMEGNRAAKRICHEYLVKLTNLQALLLDGKLELIASEDVDSLSQFFSQLAKVEIERRNSYNSPRILDQHMKRVV
jgi:ABC-type uncharacterized transport system permease subunit